MHGGHSGCIGVLETKLEKTMSNDLALAESPESSETLAGLSRRVAALEARLARKRPDTTGRRMTRPDKCPYGFRPHPKNSSRLIEDGSEQRTIFALIEMRQDATVSLRGLCQRLDAMGYKRRSGKPWAACHTLVRDILRRFNAETPAAATAFVLQRIADQKARAADRY